MSVFNFFRNLFGSGSAEEPGHEGFFDHGSFRHSFRNPIWQNDEDDDDVDDFRRPRGSMQFSIFTDPLQMTRYFEAQMESMLKDFFHGFHNEGTFGFPDQNFTGTPALPPPNPPKSSLRDKVLKPGYDLGSRLDTDNPKVDGDLDGKVSIDEFSKVWNQQDGSNALQPVVPSLSPVPFQRSVGQSITRQFFHGHDGCVVEKKTVRDSQGNEEIITSRSVGDKKYTVTIKRDKSGAETKTEDWINIPENEMQDFMDKWSHKDSPCTSNPSSILNSFLWDKLFGPNPKL